LGLQTIVQDISERKKAETALNQSNASLRRANEDLEQFSFSASHDLQEPLRTVAIYSQLLKKRFGGVLGPDGDECIGYIVQGARRMQRLVTDLLAYTEASLWNAEPAEPVSAKQALGQALGNLEAAIAETRAAITCSELPLIVMHHTHLVQLFQNLISNSINYRNQEPLRIHISAAPHEGDRWLFRVSDNGIGIDPKYHQQVFGIFKRLHREKDYPGTGIGLAICRRILEQHGERIWVDSAPGQGATFLFTLRGVNQAHNRINTHGAEQLHHPWER
jgi:light-regulated signal transduction histidine kinase (bacteriophytochrome)